ncbi:MAG: hypothetical protein ABI481_10305, partial [Pyrinomonadaceae bacterium]
RIGEIPNYHRRKPDGQDYGKKKREIIQGVSNQKDEGQSRSVVQKIMAAVYNSISGNKFVKEWGKTKNSPS